MHIVEIVASVSVIVASLTAVYGIRSWRKEYVGKCRVDLAEEVLSLFYEAQDAIRHIRSPMGFVGEGATKAEDAGETVKQGEVLDQGYVILERYDRHKALFGRLHALRYRCMALLGRDMARPFDALSDVVNNIFLAVAEYRRLRRNHGPGLLPEPEATEYCRKTDAARRIFWAGISDPDPIVEQVKIAIAQVDKAFGGIIQNQGKWAPVFERLKKAFSQEKCTVVFERINKAFPQGQWAVVCERIKRIFPTKKAPDGRTNEAADEDSHSSPNHRHGQAD